MNGEKTENLKTSVFKNDVTFDLSQEEKYDLEYQRLVKRLYGIEIIEKPELGKNHHMEESSLFQQKRVQDMNV